MRYRNLLFGLLLFLSGCTSQQKWTAHLTLDGVELFDETVEPSISFDGRTVVPTLHQHFEGQVLMTEPDAVLDGEPLLLNPPVRDGWTMELQSLQVGQGVVWAVRQNRPGFSGSDTWIEVLKLLDGEWESVVELPQLEGELYSRHGEPPVLYNPADQSVRTLLGQDFGERLEGYSRHLLVAGDVLFEVPWPVGGETQQRMIGPDCEALLAGELAAVIATPEGLETLSLVSSFLHHELVQSDCSVEPIEEIYHPAMGFEPFGSVQAGEQAWAYWNQVI